MNAHMIVGMAVAIVSCLLACGGALWRLASAITTTNSQVELNKLKIESLKDLCELGLNGLKERLDHAKNRQQTSIEDLDRRLDRVEAYLNKSTTFEK